MALARFLQPLKDEITNDPLGRGYGDMTDQDVADDLNTAYREKHRRVPMSEIHDWASGIRIFKRFADAGMVDGDLFRELTYLIQGKQEDVNFQASAASNLVSDLVSNGILTQEESQSLQGLGTYYITRANELGYGAIPTSWITACRENS